MTNNGENRNGNDSKPVEAAEEVKIETNGAKPKREVEPYVKSTVDTIKGWFDQAEEELKRSKSSRAQLQKDEKQDNVPQDVKTTDTASQATAHVETCNKLSPATGPESVVNFHQVVVAKNMNATTGEDPVEGVRSAKFACSPLVDLSVNLSFDLQYEQRWHFNQLVRGPLSASIALAPCEELALSVRNTQRTVFDKETLNEDERTSQVENSMSSTDVLNVTKSGSRQKNWTVSGSAGITLPKVSIGASGSMSGTVNSAFSSSAQNTKSTTEKSASNLKTLHKVQIKETTEVTREDVNARKIRNPYHDRTLRLDAFRLDKVYDVEFVATAVVPVLEIIPGQFFFDKKFVLDNGDFLSDKLMDQLLGFELVQALQAVKNMLSNEDEQRARDIAKMAFEYLFGDEPIMGFPVPLEATRGGTTFDLRPDDPDTWNENDAQGSFKDPLREDSGFEEAREIQWGLIYSILATYNRLYLTKIVDTNTRDESLFIELAISLAQAIKPIWSTYNAGDIAKIFDLNRKTEVFRKLPGFLAITDGILTPLLQPVAEENEEKLAQRRAGKVIDRVIAHLGCHKEYYSEQFLHYLAEKTEMRMISRFVADVMRFNVPGLENNGLSIFDPDSAFLNRNSIIVPVRIAPNDSQLLALLKELQQDAPSVELGILEAYRVTVPTDGAHIEAISGECVLNDVPEQIKAGPIHVAVETQ